MNVELHEHHIETEVRDGIERTILVIKTDIPIPPQTHIDKEMLPEIIQKISQIYADRGKLVDDVRLIYRTPNKSDGTKLSGKTN